MALIEISLFVLLLIFIVYKWATFKYNTFQERGVPFEKPSPFGGNVASVLFNKESFFKNALNFYRRNKAHIQSAVLSSHVCTHMYNMKNLLFNFASKIVGYYNFRDPVFMVNDPECIKKILIKDFDFFPNHTPVLTSSDDKLVNCMLNVMKDQRWKDMRNTLTPIFTASKMRSMFPLMNECFNESLDKLREKTKSGQPYELELKQWFTRLSNDVIASTAFGLKVNSYENVNNEFYTIGQSITNFRGKQLFKFFLANAAPWLMRLLGWKIFDPAQTNYFKRLVVDTMKYRKEHNIIRPDMIQLLMEAQKESGDKWSDEELVAQCFSFFFAAFENNANLICTVCHELMDNPDMQERLYEESLAIKEQLKKAPLNYDTVGKMNYMEMVVSEALRKWALAAITDRKCSKDYTLLDEDDKLVFEFKAGDYVWIPINGLHRDERYFEHPDIFDPERFSENRKNEIKPCTYLPFGIGPRACIGNRYALMQAKAMLYYLVLEYKLERSPKTVTNLLDDIRGAQVNPQNGFWTQIVPRK